MYELVKQLGVGAFLAREAGPLVVSLAVAELLFKFHSFTLEALAFLATWYLISGVAAALITRRRGK